MRLLLDTHALLWWWLDDPRLSPRADALIRKSETEVFVSAASAMEIATKVRIGKLPAARSLAQGFETALVDERFLQLPITVAHACQAGSLAGDHRDPFDRILAAQAMIADLTVVTADSRIAAFGARTLW